MASAKQNKYLRAHADPRVCRARSIPESPQLRDLHVCEHRDRLIQVTSPLRRPFLSIITPTGLGEEPINSSQTLAQGHLGPIKWESVEELPPFEIAAEVKKAVSGWRGVRSDVLLHREKLEDPDRREAKETRVNLWVPNGKLFCVLTLVRANCTNRAHLSYFILWRWINQRTLG